MQRDELRVEEGGMTWNILSPYQRDSVIMEKQKSWCFPSSYETDHFSCTSAMSFLQYHLHYHLLKSSFWMLAWFGDLEREREKRYLQLSPHPYFEHTISHQNKHKHKKEQIFIKKTHKYLNANKMWKTKYGKVGAEVLRSAPSTDTWLPRLPIYWPEPKLGQISYFYQRNTHNRIWEIWRRKNHSSDTQSRYGK